MSRRASRGLFFVNLLGGFQVAGPTATDTLLLERRKTCALVALLARDPGHAMARGKLTTLLWGEQSEDAARHALRQCLLDLRQVLTKAKVEALRVEADSIGLDSSTVVVDAERFERRIAQGTPEALQEAMVLYRGDLLEGFSVKEVAFEDWLRGERERLRTQAIDGLKGLLAHYVRKKIPDAAIQVAIRLIALEPFDEAVHRTLMRLYAESGRRSTALRQYEDCVEILGRELGVEPAEETRDLYRKLVSERAKPATGPLVERTRGSRVAQASRARVVSPSTVQTPLIGREADLEWLDTLSECAHKRQPQLVLIVGEAGIGKSRLVEELGTRARQRRVEILFGRGREGESVLAFAPWVEALRQALRDDIVKRLSPTIRRDLSRLFPEIDDGPSPSPGGLEDGPRIFEAVAHLLRQLASGRPLLIVIEDLHWCDDMTTRLLRFLPRRLEGHRVLLVATARPEETPDDPVRRAALDTLYRDQTYVSRTLRPLPRDETMLLFRALMTSRDYALSTELAERMWRLSEGNPFVVVECARAVRERGAAGHDASLNLPDQVRVLTARCFAELSGRAARLADVAAVIGRDFDAAVLGHASGLAESEVADGVEELVRRRILREIDGRFDFGHDRMREVAYARLSEPRRTLLHRRVAQSLETVYAAELDAHGSAIGAHYREARAWEPASKYLARAGFQAWERGAGREAMACFEGALDAITRLPDVDERRERQVHLRLVANGASAASGSYERGRPHLLEAEKLARTLSDRRWYGHVAAALTNSYRAAGTLDQALRYGQLAVNIARETGDGGLESAATFALGYTEFTSGRFRLSANRMPALLRDDARCSDLEGPFLPFVDKRVWMRALARYILVINCVQLGEFDTGMRFVSESFEEIDTLDDPLDTSRMFANLGLGKLHTARGDFDDAVRAFEAALAVYREDCHRNFYRPLGWGLGLAYALAGRVSEGLARLERAEIDERSIGSRSFNEMLWLHLGRALLQAGRIDDAARRANDAVTLAREQGNRPSEAGGHGLLGEVARLRSSVDYEAMERHNLDALTMAEALEMRPLAARCHLRLAWLYERTGREQCKAHASAATILLAQMGHPRSLDGVAVH